MRLRDYQQRTIEMLYQWMRDNPGNPCIVMPTGSGKSVIISELARGALTNWPDTRILILAAQKELLEQNSDKLRAIWPGAPMGIYSAAMGRRNLDEPITFAGIQSVRNRADQIGHVDIIVVDEAHMISHKVQGAYRTLIDDLTAINPSLRVVGLTATPWRLGHGKITDAPAIFDALIEPTRIEELIHDGYLAPLRSKVTSERLDTSGVHKRGGEYIEAELARAVDKQPITDAVVDEVIDLAGDRRSWLFFCSGVAHSEHVRDALVSRGIVAECVTGKTPKLERERILREFKAGLIQAVTNADVLTTGFDAPNIDLIALLRPTMSPVLYVQMVGRGCRLKEHTDHCLVLDFAGVVEQHGPVTSVQPPRRKGEGGGEAPIKVCDECHEICHAGVKACPACGYAFPAAEKEPLRLRDVDIMGIEASSMQVTSWAWRRHVSQRSGKEMALVTYYGQLSDAPVREYLTLTHEGHAGASALRKLAVMARDSGADISGCEDIPALCDTMTEAAPPERIEYRKEGKFYRVENRQWRKEYAEAS